MSVRVTDVIIDIVYHIPDSLALIGDHELSPINTMDGLVILWTKPKQLVSIIFIILFIISIWISNWYLLVKDLENRLLLFSLIPLIGLICVNSDLVKQ